MTNLYFCSLLLQKLLVLAVTRNYITSLAKNGKKRVYSFSFNRLTGMSDEVDRLQEYPALWLDPPLWPTEQAISLLFMSSAILSGLNPLPMLSEVNFSQCFQCSLERHGTVDRICCCCCCFGFYGPSRLFYSFRPNKTGRRADWSTWYKSPSGQLRCINTCTHSCVRSNDKESALLTLDYGKGPLDQYGTVNRNSIVRCQ